MATIFKLIIEDDEGKTTVYPLADGSVSIGRKDGNTIRLMERNVSRRHARLLRNNGAVFIEDLDSYNGIRINGERIAGRYEVKEGDLVEIGDFHLALQRSEIAEEANARSQSHDGWRQAGTVPDMALPGEMLGQGGGRADRDTIMDQPAAPAVAGAVARTVGAGALDAPVPPSQPLVKPPPRGETGGSGDLPPFPGPGGLPAPKSPMYGESSQATEAVGQDRKLSVGPAYVSSVPRLVCVSTLYAGKEFALTRPEIIIGRVEDNDIVIEHRSVSRNHAKVIFDGRTHKIIDLQSANGILVNGEEYAMTDLRKGDLIELGHVRFRFTPADEPFVATDDEAREMREAGVEPPSAPEPAPSNGPSLQGLIAPPSPAGHDVPIPAYDPSTAATVTDTPLDALGLSDMAAPSIGGPSAAPAPMAREPGRPRASEDQRPTELNSVPQNHRPSAAALSATVPEVAKPKPKPEPQPRMATVRTESEVEVPPDGPKKILLVVIAALLVTAVILAFMVLSGGGSSERQAALQTAFADENWDQVVELYEADPADFEDPKAMALLYRKAVAGQAAAAATPDPTPEPETAPPEGDPVADPEPLEPVGDPEPDDVELPAGDAESTRTDAAPDRRRPPPKRPAAKRKPKPANLDRLVSQGKTALLQGDLTSAERYLKRCLASDPNHAACHRALGVLYAQKDDTQRALRHYRKYVELMPNAVDADRVRQMIRKAEEASSGAAP